MSARPLTPAGVGPLVSAAMANDSVWAYSRACIVPKRSSVQRQMSRKSASAAAVRSIRQPDAAAVTQKVPRAHFHHRDCSSNAADRSGALRSTCCSGVPAWGQSSRLQRLIGDLSNLTDAKPAKFCCYELIRPSSIGVYHKILVCASRRRDQQPASTQPHYGVAHRLAVNP